MDQTIFYFGTFTCPACKRCFLVYGDADRQMIYFAADASGKQISPLIDPAQAVTCPNCGANVTSLLFWQQVKPYNF